MASRTELRGLLKQNPRASMITDERFPSSSSSKDQGKIKERKRRDTDNEISARSKAIGHRSNDCVNGSFNRDDELIKYMSKLPGYLQREVREGKVLNIGVLDWGSLEKWKHSQNGGRATECNNVLSNGPSTSGKTERKLSARTSGIIPKDSHRCKIDEQSASCSNLGKDYTSRDLQHSVQRVPSTLEAEPVSRDPSHKHQKPGFGYKSSGRDHAVADPGKGRKTQLSQDFGSSLFPDMGNSEGSLDVKEGEVFRDGEKQKRVEGKRHAVEAKQKSLNPVSDDVVIGGGQSVRSSQKITTESQEPEEAGLAPRKQENQFGNIVLLRPRKHTRSALPRKFLMSMDDDAQIAKPDEFSTCFANESSNSSELQRSQIPRSCPLSLEFGAELPSDALSEKEHSETVSRILDQEKSEEGFRRRRHPSPGKRSSFSFSLLSRSFSFKEDSAIQSDPMRFDDVSEKWNINRGARASPLRRLLDPLLKAKVSETAVPAP
ncbi:PREDICTED: uncharacterized protein LOC104824512 [Tarenaya hassleriana]|uniref:uncharacterized protein LOC104824512 n=1 Tax=Tarenaya hassleriana TaxID=28532 RepID=UPI00053CA10F|nr:PREDICTED: uncharacterized protein LOC104824512 [Tarenaya hassleriana]